MAKRWILSTRRVVVEKPVRDAVVVYSGRTGKLIEMPAETWRTLIYESTTYEGVTNATDFKPLIEAELLVPWDQNEREFLIDRNARASAVSRTLYQVIMPSGNCNFGCDYCGQTHLDKKLSFDDCDRLRDRIRVLLTTRGFSDLAVCWFGGEPLIALDRIRYLTSELYEVCTDVSASYSSKIVTNGMLLSAAVSKELVEEHSVRGIEVTLDGTASHHNARRPQRGGGGTFLNILGNLQDVADTVQPEAARLGVRCNVDRRNYDSTFALIDQLADMGLKDRVYFYCAPVYAWGDAPGQSHAFTRQEWGEAEISILRYLAATGFSNNPLPSEKLNTCMHTRRDSHVVDPDGKLFTCTEIPLVTDASSTVNLTVGGNSIGNVKHLWYDGHLSDESYDSRDRSSRSWGQELRDEMWPCANCELLGVCGGACPKQWREGNRACPGYKFNISDRIQIASEQGRAIQFAPNTVESITKKT